MSRKGKGINAERELIHLLWRNGWSAIRVAGSGSSHFPSPDILAGNTQRILAIECKTTKSELQYLSKEKIEQLKLFGRTFGAEPVVGVKFKQHPWFFIPVDILKETNKNFVISVETAKQKGFEIEDLIDP